MLQVRSMADLEAIFAERGISQEQTRFFINRNMSEPKCFGIYYDEATGNYVVYKNKADGSRFVRYEGPSETEACSIFFDKLNEETFNRKAAPELTPEQKKKQKRTTIIVIVVIVLLCIICCVGVKVSNDRSIAHRTARGYYSYGDDLYYYLPDYGYYYYDYADYNYNGIYDWELVDDSYFYGLPYYDSFAYDEYYDSSYGYYDFYDTYYYSDYQESNSSSSYDSDTDYGYDYDYDSWDSGDTDWGSDW